MGNKNKFGRDGQSTENVSNDVHARPASLSTLSEKERWIGEQLRQVYEAALEEPVPEHLIDLLNKLDGNGQSE